MVMNDECVFCGIIEDEIPSHKIYEDEEMVAILDANPVSKGHTLVIPKKHVETIDEAEGMDYLFKGLVKVSNALKDTFDPEGINVAQNNGEAAGQEVFHLHFHVTPIYDGTELEITYDRSELEDGDDLAERIRERI